MYNQTWTGLKDWVCDGQADCQDASDERNCPVLVQHFMCDSGDKVEIEKGGFHLNCLSCLYSKEVSCLKVTFLSYQYVNEKIQHNC